MGDNTDSFRTNNNNSMPSSDLYEDEETGLLRTKKKKPSMAQRGVTANRIGMLLLTAILVGISIYYQLEVNDLTKSLQHEHERASKLDQTLQMHQQVIERFNSSITNTDVVDRLNALEDSLQKTKTSLESELTDTQTRVTNELNTTLAQLKQTVNEAENEIHQEVDRVKKDVESYVVETQDRFSMENSFMVYQLAGTFTLLSCLISMWHMTAHLRKMNQPDVQRKILAILWMSPIYAITSWFSLVFQEAEGYLAIIKDGYEAYIIYQFLSFLIAVLGKGDRDKVVDLLARRADHLTPPFRLFGCFELCCGCCRPPPYESNRALADEILLQCQFFAMQFVFFRPLTTTAMVVLREMNYYGAGTGPTDYRSPQFYITIVQNISIFTAFAGLLKFYHAVDKDLAWCRPFAKFLCIKGVVFMTFWQGLAISILATTTGVAGDDDDAAEWAASAQNFLICLEMLLFSIAHFYCFPTEEWQEGYRVKHSRGNFGDSIALGDFFTDLKLILGSNSNGKDKTPKRSSVSDKLEEAGAEEKEVEKHCVSTPVSAKTQQSHQSHRSREESAQKDITRVLESLGAAGGDDAPDIAEAKKRLLESKILSPEFFDEIGSFDDVDWSDVENGSKEEEIGGSNGDHLSGSANDVAEESVNTPAQTSEVVSPPPTNRVETGEIDERSGLLSNRSDGTALRPSFFTVVSSFMDDENANTSLLTDDDHDVRTLEPKNES